MGLTYRKMSTTMKKILFLLQGILLVASFMLPQAVLAAESASCAGDDLAKIFCEGSLSDSLNAAFQVAISVGAVLAMLRIGYAGWLYMGRDDMWSSKQAAKEVFSDAIIGLLILLAIYMILYQINPEILSLNINVLDSSSGSGLVGAHPD